METAAMTFGGKPWKQTFILKIDAEKCIGCGRCYKVCGRDVLDLVDKPFAGDDEYGDDMGNKIMTVVNRDNCIGCGSCGRICSKKCHGYE